MHKIFDGREIEQEKTKPYFKQEYCRFYDFDTRNLFTATTLNAIEHLVQIDASYDTIHYNIHKSLGIDIGYGSSKTAFTITEHVDGHIRVIHSQAFSRPLSEEMINDALNLIFHFKLNRNSNQVHVDGANPGDKDSKSEYGDMCPYRKAMITLYNRIPPTTTSS